MAEISGSMKSECLSEDSVEYRLFPCIPASVAAAVHPSAVDDFLGEQLGHCLAFLGRYSVDYIWQNEPFRLHVVAGTGTSCRSIVCSR